ncbi:hypothetical protein FOL46_006348, partial [Perkinsus olseni]
NLASDVTIMALGIFRLVVVANDWMERSVSDLLLNDVAALMCFGDTAERFSSPLELMYLMCQLYVIRETYRLLRGADAATNDSDEPVDDNVPAHPSSNGQYGLVVFFTLINFFIAIISRAFGEAQGELEHFPVAQQFITDVAHLVLTSATSWLGLKRTFSYDYGGAHYRQEGAKWPSRARVIRALDGIVQRTESHAGLQGGDNIVLEQHQDDEGHQQLEAVNVNWERRAHVDLIPQHDRLHMESMTVSAREIINQIREKRYIRGFDDDGMQDLFMHYMKLYGRQPHQFLHRDFQLPERDPIFDLHTVVQTFSKSIDTTLTVGFRRTIALLKDLRQSELDCVSKAREVEQLLPAMETARCASEQLERKVFGRPLRDDEDAGELLAQRRSRLREMTNRLNAHVMSTESMLDQYLPPPDWRQRLAAQGKTVSGGGRGDAVMQKRRAEEQKKRQLEALIAYRARKAPPKAPSTAMNPDAGWQGASSAAQIAGAKSRPVVKGAKLKALPYKKASPSEIRRMLEEAKRNRQR